MPQPRLFQPREWLGFTGQPLPLNPEADLPAGIVDRFKRTGQESFLPYLNPFDTLARAQEIKGAERGLAIRDAEDAFVDNLAQFSGEDEEANATGFRQFLQKNPLATFSPMVRTYEQVHRPYQTRARYSQDRDPYISSVAGMGSEALNLYRSEIAQHGDSEQARAKVIDQFGRKAKTEDDQLQFVEKGGTLKDWDKVKDLSPAGRLDFINQQGRIPTASDLNKVAELEADIASGVRTMEGYKNDEDSYKSAVERELGREPKTEADWTDGYNKLQTRLVQGSQKALDSYVRERRLNLGEQNVPQIQPVPIQSVQAPQPQIVAPKPEIVPQQIAPVAPQPAPVQPVAQPAFAPPSPALDSLWKEFDAIEKVPAEAPIPGLPPTPDLYREKNLLAEAGKKGIRDEKRRQIMTAMNLPDTAKGREIFENVWRGKNIDSSPVQGVTGISWKITPAK